MLAELPIDIYKSPSFERLAIAMKIRVQNKWLETSQTPTKISAQMKTWKPLEGSTRLRASKDYPSYFQIRQERPMGQSNVVNDLMRYYKTPQDLAKMLLIGLINPNKNAAFELLDRLLMKWVDEAVSPNTVRNWLQVKDFAIMAKLRGHIESLNKKYSEMYEQREKASDEILDSRPVKRLKTAPSEH